GIAQAVGEVAAVDDEGVAGLEQLLRHLVDEIDEGVPQNLEGDRIEVGVGRHDGRRSVHCVTGLSSRTRLPFGSPRTRLAGGLTTVESSCSTIAGPWKACPARKAVRWWIGVSAKPPASSNHTLRNSVVTGAPSPRGRSGRDGLTRVPIPATRMPKNSTGRSSCA